MDDPFSNIITLSSKLLDFEVDIYAFEYENNHEMTPPIVIDALEGCMDVLRILRQRGVEPNLKSSNETSALSALLRHVKQDRVDFLRKYGAKE